MVLMVSVLCSAKTTEELKDGEYTKKQLLEDFDQLTGAFKFSHPKSFTDMDNFEKVTKQQRKKVPNMTEYEFFRVLAPVVGSMRCGHSYIYLSTTQINCMVIPMQTEASCLLM